MVGPITITNKNEAINTQISTESNNESNTNSLIQKNALEQQQSSIKNDPLETVKSVLVSIKDRYAEYKRNKEERLNTFPTPKTYPTKPHQLQPEQLRKYNFAQLSPEETEMLDDLSTFTPHREFVKMLTNKYSDMKKKEYFIKEHASILSSEEFGDFNRAKYDYENNSRTFAAFATGSLTVAGLLVGLYVLPARKSPWKYSLIGLGVGLGLSYGFWRFQIFRYHEKMNEQFKSIMKEKYQDEKKQQRLRESRNQ